MRAAGILRQFENPTWKRIEGALLIGADAMALTLNWYALLGYYPWTITIESDAGPMWQGELVLYVSNRTDPPDPTIPAAHFAPLGDVITEPASFTMAVPYKWIAAYPRVVSQGAVSVYIMGAQFSRGFQP